MIMEKKHTRWPIWYIAVVLWLAALIVFFYLFTKTYS